jgi:dihydroorotase
MVKLKLTRPDDWHLHLRQGSLMSSVVEMTARQMGRAVVMPNLSPPIRTVGESLKYRSEIIASLPKQSSFNPLMTLYLTDQTTKQDIIDASQNEHVYAVKLYPAGATTNSDDGVTALSSLYSTIEQMQKEEMPLLIHGEVTHAEVDVFDREKVFIETILDPPFEKVS